MPKTATDFACWKKIKGIFVPKVLKSCKRDTRLFECRLKDKLKQVGHSYFQIKRAFPRCTGTQIKLKICQCYWETGIDHLTTPNYLEFLDLSPISLNNNTIVISCDKKGTVDFLSFVYRYFKHGNYTTMSICSIMQYWLPYFLDYLNWVVFSFPWLGHHHVYGNEKLNKGLDYANY